MKNKITIVLLGDSITSGIGSKMINYENELQSFLLQNGLKSTIINLALTGTTIKYAQGQLELIEKYSPDYIVIMYGSVDLQIRPNMDTNRFGILSLTPKRYKLIKGMLNPRPFMSRKRLRFIVDCLDNLYRKIWKKVVIATQGTMQYLTEEEFEKEYENVIRQLSDYKIICSSTMFVDSKIYEDKTIKNYKCANEFLDSIRKKYSNIIAFADIFSMQQKIVDRDNSFSRIFYNDHFHPNEYGYYEISHVIGKIIVDDLKSISNG